MASASAGATGPSQVDNDGSELQGVVFNTQGYSLHDGPGIRTIVFLKGCPLRCAWCCNPESQRLEPELEFHPLECIACGHCVSACPREAINPDLHSPPERKVAADRCDGCLACVRACPAGALRAVGERMTVNAVMAIVLRDAPVYRRSGGGLTISGGEPLMQWQFARALARAAHERNVSVALETTGQGQWSAFAAVLEHVDLVLFDLKQMDAGAHRAATGVGNALPLANLRRLAAANMPVIIRLPLIPGYNLDSTHLHAAGALAAEIGAREVHLMPFHQLASEKYRRRGQGYALAGVPGLRDTPEGRARIEWARQIIAEYCVPAIVGGG